MLVKDAVLKKASEYDVGGKYDRSACEKTLNSALNSLVGSRLEDEIATGTKTSLIFCGGESSVNGNIAEVKYRYVLEESRGYRSMLVGVLAFDIRLATPRAYAIVEVMTS